MRSNKRTEGRGRIPALLTVLLAALAAALLLAGCGGGRESTTAETEPGKKTFAQSYNARQIYVLLASQMQNISEVYTDEVFGIRVNYEGDTYRDACAQIMKDYLVKLSYMTEMSRERGLQLSSDEKKAVETGAADYLQVLEQKDNVYGITKNDIEKLLTDLYTVPKLRELIMSEMHEEISESEARVADIILLVTESSDDAYSALAEAGEGGDFAAAAEKYSVEEETARQVGRTDLPAKVSEVVFGLEDGELSPVILYEGRYYVIQCVNGYNVEATAVRKERIYREKLAQAIGTAYDGFLQTHELEFDEEAWKEALSMADEPSGVPNIYTYLPQ